MSVSNRASRNGRPPPERGHATRRASIDFLPALFLAAALLFLPSGPESSSLNSLAIVFVSIVLEAIPFMLIGSLVGGLIEAFVSRERMTTLLPRKGWLTVCLAAGAGIVFPVCECAVVPVVRRLIGKGLPFSAAIAYLLGGPIVNPIVAASTVLAYAFDWRIVMMRMCFGYGLAVVIGMLMGRLFAGSVAIKDYRAGQNNNASPCACHHHAHCETDSAAQAPPLLKNQAGNTTAYGCGRSHSTSDGWDDKVGAAFIHAMDDFLAVAHFVAMGFMLAAMVRPKTKAMDAPAVLRALVLLVPVLYAMAMPDTMLGNQAFKKRFTGTNNEAMSRQAPPVLSSQESENNQEIIASLEELESTREDVPQERTILEIYLNPNFYKGQRVIVTGMILRDDQLKPHFGGRDTAIYRFLINCCAADALPLAIALDSDKTDAFTNDQWVQVNGIFDLQQIDDKPVPTVSKAKIKPIEEPAVPYLF